MVKPSLPVDIYIRVSRVGGRDRLISPDEQERRARTLAKERGLRVGRVLTDLDESGGKLERPGLQEALQRVEAGKSGGLVVAWLDRLSRDSEHAHGLVRRLSEAGGVVYAPDAPADWTSPEGELQAGLIFAFAMYQRKRARAGFERAKEQAIERGIPVHSRAPVGYRARPDRRLEPDPNTAPAILELFERRARGEGPAALGRFLQEQKVKTSQGSTVWSKQAVYGLIRNRVYLGELGYGRDGRFVNTESHEGIVDLALWQAAQHPNGRQLASARSVASEFLLTGLLRCSGCGYSLQATRTSRGKRIYRCTRTHAGGICPEPVRAFAESVEEAATETFWSVTKDLKARGRVDVSGELARLEKALEKAERRLGQWSSQDVQDAIGDLAEYANGLKERRQARDDAAARLGEARAKSSIATVLPVKTLRDEWNKATAQERRQLLSLRFDCIALSRDRLVVYPTGTGPTNLPRRGYNREATLRPFADRPRGTRVLGLQPPA